MKISYNWLQEYFAQPLPDPKELANLLNVRALEVEDIEEWKSKESKDGGSVQDNIFEIKVTPNRASDCLSHLGIAQEISLHTQKPLIKHAEVEPTEAQFDTEFSVETEDLSCMRYMAREIRNVLVKESPLELKEKLESIGQRSINTIVDITNLVLHEIGQPTHTFDANKISGKKIMVGAPQFSNITTLDGMEKALSNTDIVIQDEEGNLAIAGVKGGKKAEVNLETKNIVLESATFFQTQVRQTSKRVGIQNDSSKRFENGITPKRAEQAMHLVAQYIKMYASTEQTEFSNIIDVYPRPQMRPQSVGVHLSHISQKLGIDIPEEQLPRLVPSLGFKKVESIEEIRDHVDHVLNAPYQFGAHEVYDAPRSFDCSSLMMYLYSLIGVWIPRTSVDQYVFSTAIKKEELQFGDLIFNNSNEGSIHYDSKVFLKGTLVTFGIDHVGMYMGDGKVLHSSRYLPSGTSIENLSQSKQFQNIVACGRVATHKDFPRFVYDIPYERLDISLEIDLIEEIGRTYGYEHIAPVAPPQIIQHDATNQYKKITTLKSVLIENGFSEAVTYSFQNKGDIEVVKPLAQDKNFLRTNLSADLMRSLELNIKNKELFAIDTIKLFEIGSVFQKEREKQVLGIAVKSSVKSKKSKSLLEEIVHSLQEKLSIVLDVQIKDGQEILEIDLEKIISQMTSDDSDLGQNMSTLEGKTYVPFSTFPYSARDIAVWARGSKTKSDIEDIIRTHGTDLLLRFDLFDEYKTEDKTSYAYRLVFQSSERTLTDEEIQPIMDTIYGALQADSDFEIR